MKITKILISFLLFTLIGLSFNFAFTGPVYAGDFMDLDNQEGFKDDEIPNTFGESGEPEDVRSIIANIIKAVLGFLALIFLIIIIIGGFEWMTAGGNEEKVKKAKSRISNGIIGVVIILSAYAIADFVISCVLDITSDAAFMCD